MSMSGGFSQGRSDVGEVVATVPTYEAAQQTVSRLIAGDVPAREIAIVGHDLRSVERITGRLGYATAARSGAVNGLLLGLLFAAIFVIGQPSVPIAGFIGVMFVGIAVGMLLSLLMFALLRRRRDFASVMQVVAERYEVTVAATSIHTARRVIGGAAAAAPAAAAPSVDAPPAAAEPPRYGERIAPRAEGPESTAPSHPAAESDRTPGEEEPPRSEPDAPHRPE